jgi:HD-GYP domain-containing protein (c-di-GMP phosphodiesterase class II)
MGSILIWGKTRELVAGELPPGVSLHEVADLAELRSGLEVGGGPLVLIGAPQLESHREAIEAWLKVEGAFRAVLAGVCDAGESDDLLRRFPFLDDMLLRPVTPGRLRLRLERALDMLHNRRAVRQLERALDRKSQELHELNKIGVALSAERDIDKLLELILAKCREITVADAGSLYLVERGKERDSQADDRLRFTLTQNDSVVVQFEEFRMPLNESSIAGYVALTGRSVNLADAYCPPVDASYTISRSFDEKSGYRTKSMLVVPMRDHQDMVIGVIQLINKKKSTETVLRPVSVVDELVVPFTPVDQELVTSLASQAAVAFENTLLLGDIKKLFDAFVRASVTAIESRDPTTSGHSERVATLTVGLAESIDAVEGGRFRDVRFTRDQMQELRFASLLHDFGKVGVKEKVLIKGKKLYVGELLLVRQRFAYIQRTLEAEHLRTKLDLSLGGRAAPEILSQLDREYEAKQREVEGMLRMIMQANEPTVLEEEGFRALMDLTQRTYGDLDGNRQPFLAPGELAALSISKGSLSDRERREIESHVTHTYRFLSKIPWTGEYSLIPEIAYAHHEKLDGSGYPRGLPGARIPIQSRMMTIADIFDALVAWDRPYKRSVPVERALDILSEEAADGKLDRDLLDVFVRAKIFEKTTTRLES